MEILKVQAINKAKTVAMAEKIVQGRIGKFYAEMCLVEDSNTKVSKLIEAKEQKS